MKRRAIAAIIARDLLRADDARPETATRCFTCGLGMTYRGKRFCSDRCREYYDAGNPGHAQDWRQPKPDYGGLKPTKNGFTISCEGCSRPFESKGLRCCSPDCERRYRERQANLAAMAEARIEAKTKRRCAGPDCGAPIPEWRNGRRVRANALFCSPRCAQQAARKRKDAA